MYSPVSCCMHAQLGQPFFPFSPAYVPASDGASLRIEDLIASDRKTALPGLGGGIFLFQTSSVCLHLPGQRPTPRTRSVVVSSFYEGRREAPEWLADHVVAQVGPLELITCACACARLVSPAEHSRDGPAAGASRTHLTRSIRSTVFFSFFFNSLVSLDRRKMEDSTDGALD
jgi:hypothetical protein